MTDQLLLDRALRYASEHRRTPKLTVHDLARAAHACAVDTDDLYARAIERGYRIAP